VHTQIESTAECTSFLGGFETLGLAEFFFVFWFFLKKYFIRFRTHNPSAERGHEARQVPQGQQCVNDDLIPSQIGARPQGYRVAADGAAAPAIWDQAILGTHVERWEGEKKKKKKKKND
jgi:hypothetical protein